MKLTIFSYFSVLLLSLLTFVNTMCDNLDAAPTGYFKTRIFIIFLVVSIISEVVFSFYSRLISNLSEALLKQLDALDSAPIEKPKPKPESIFKISPALQMAAFKGAGISLLLILISLLIRRYI